MSIGHQRWYHDPKTGLPTIRPRPDAHEYRTPDEVKRMVAGQEPDCSNYPIQGSCPNCGGPADSCEDDE